ncbi:hypothetical protein BABINDRAFT_93187 [Babjeviella inositovora NRRL Y-12698]|uniref:Mitochondrial presequence protease n=1 Tax=Babjeviella inositovora NRRL Y-12698 TaxID=984486 RepID=A0A1E3QKB0_9ASCO|nr:uncharacterized protein BABINDRAFT_93187 [Babjeviella inositovora NRRL Y-12698]ODQ78123.1 hypothetical protein BABINDRAFT_93187 [Babjeviella inositovora NRRL Y-12698]
MTNLQLQSSFKVDYAPAHIKKWRSSRTGLQLTYINQSTPVVNGYFAVATECTDDSGSPHTLEHLIFMGSDNYKYKGLLDTLGNRCFSSTNAWTAVDQTVYTLTTAGWEGFQMLLPIYLDHLFRPTLTDEACYTEVYHIDGKAKEKGVVFSEMQGIANQSWFLSDLESSRALYSPESGYSSETGGLLPSLRELTNERISKFHRDNYRSDNLCVIITGSVDETELLATIEKFDAALPTLADLPPHKRPFVDSPVDTHLQLSVLKTIEFPDDDESSGEIQFNWLGPAHGNVTANVALDILGTYLTDSPAAYLQQALVEIDEPLATEVEYYTSDLLRTRLVMNVSGVPYAQLDTVAAKVLELLTAHTVDVVRVRQVLEQQRLKFVFATEKSPELLSTIAIEEFMYGNVDGTDLAKWTQNLDEYDELLEWTEEQWTAMLRLVFVSSPHVTVIARPSATLYEEHKKVDKALLKKRKGAFGKEGLEKLRKKLEDATALNDTPIPEALLVEFGRPDPAKIEFINTVSVKAGTNTLVDSAYTSGASLEVARHVAADAQLPLFFHFEHYESQFITVNAMFGSFAVPEALLPYMELFEELMFALPIQNADGSETPYQDAIAALKQDTVEAWFHSSFQGQFDEVVNVTVQVEKHKVAKAVEWIRKSLFDSVFTKARVKNAVDKLALSLPEKKRDGSTMLNSVYNRSSLSARSMRVAKDCLTLEAFLKDTSALLESDEGLATVLATLNEVRSQLFTNGNMRLVVAGDILSIEKPVSVFDVLVIGNTTAVSAIPRTLAALKPESDVRGKAFLISAPASDSAYLIAATKIPTDYLHPDMPKIALVSEYLQAVEGPFWRGIRGTGLAYGANIHRDLEFGNLMFDIYRGSDGEEALKVAHTIIQGFATGETPFVQSAMEGAVASLVNTVVNGQSNSLSTGNGKILDVVFKNRGGDFTTKFLGQVQKLTVQDLQDTTNKYFVNLFDAGKSSIFGCVSPSKEAAFTETLTRLGYQVSVETLEADHEESGEETGEEETGDEETDSEDIDSDETDSEETDSETGSEASDGE